MPRQKLLLFSLILVSLGLFFVACESEETPTATPPQATATAVARPIPHARQQQ